MASARDWADGYLGQARADLKGAHAVSGAEPSVLAMLLQMVFEKFAKAAHPQHPQRMQGTPQLEYPWATSEGTIAWPAHDLPVARSLRPPSALAVRVLRFATLLDQHFDRIFP